jgi:hypothetical protein
MSNATAVDLTPAEAAELLHHELSRASQSLQARDLDEGFDAYVRALGLALQLGPVPTGEALAAILLDTQRLVRSGQEEGLSALGPAVVDLVARVREAGALPRTAAMDAWAALSSSIGTLIGQLGLALEIPADHRADMVENLRVRAVALDDATGGLFDLAVWVEELTVPGNARDRRWTLSVPQNHGREPVTA